MQVSSGDVWKADVSLFNSVDGIQFSSKEFILKKHGQMLWYPGGNYKVRCPINTLRYPFDEQVCHICVGAWQLDTSTQTMALYGNGHYVERSAYGDGTWEIINVSSEIAKSDHDQLYSFIKIRIKLQRRLLFPLLNVLVPVLLLSFLNAVVFLLPVQSGEKITLCVSVLISFTVYLTMLNDILPQTSINLPFVYVYLCMQMFSSVLSIIATTVIIRRDIIKDTHILETKDREIFKRNENLDENKTKDNNGLSSFLGDNVHSIDNEHRVGSSEGTSASKGIIKANIVNKSFFEQRCFKSLDLDLAGFFVTIAINILSAVTLFIVICTRLEASDTVGDVCTGNV